MVVVIDKHLKTCDCSYCSDGAFHKKLHYGLNVPKDKSFNSWWVIKYGKNKYFRFTLPFLRKPKK